MHTVRVEPVTENDMTIEIEFHPSTDQIIINCDISPIDCSGQQMEQVVEQIQRFLNQ